MHENEILELLEGKVRIPRLPPLPDPEFYRKEKYKKSDLLKFHLQEAKSRQIADYLEYRAIKSKIATYHVRDTEEVKEITRPSNFYPRILKQEAESVEPPPMQKQWEREILGLIPYKLYTKYTAVLNECFLNVKAEYTNCLRKLGVERMLKPIDGEERHVFKENGFKFLGKTARYHVYLKNRDKIKQTLFLLHPIIRNILAKAVRMFPSILNDYSKYRSLGILDVAQLKDLMDSDLKRSANVITAGWYPQVIKLFSARRALNALPKRLWPKFLNCASHIVSTQITELMCKSILDLLDVTSDKYRVPLIKFNLDHQEPGLTLDPSLEDTYQMYHGIINSIASTAQELAALENWIDVPKGKDFITVKCNEMFLDWAHDQLDANLDALYLPIKNYAQELDQEFNSLYNDKTFQEINVFINQENVFAECLEKIHYFESFIEKISDMCMNEFFDVGKVCQSQLITTLKIYTEDIIDIFIEIMLRKHSEEDRNICNSFEELVKRALTQPKTTEELMELGQYMLYANTIFMDEMKERIKVSLNVLVQLLEMTTISDEDMALNTETVLWLQKIKPIFKQYNSLYEQYKFEFEEELQRRNESLNRSIEDLLPRLVVLNLMDEVDHVNSYVDDINKYLRKIEHYDEQVAWINKEEALFKFPISTFPELDELKNIIDPFAKLVFLCNKWRKYQHIWMDGNFDDLKIEFVEYTVEDIYKEIIKAQKNYKSKIRQQTAENYARRFRGNAEDPEFAHQPAPIKLCMKTATEIKGFRHNVTLVGILCNPALTQRHWDEMSEIVGFDLTPDAGTTLRKMVALELTPYIDRFEIVSISANKELALQLGLAKMKAEWADIRFTTNMYKETNIPILSTLDDVQALLDDHLIKTLSMRGSAFVKPFEAEVRAWYDKLTRINKTIEEWGKVQAQWLYLLPIFSSKDIISQMPEEGILFQEVDNTYKRIMTAVIRDPRVLETAGAVGLLETLQDCTGMLETINEGVNAYLEKKRLFFPRFFFLSNDEMLEILSETKDPLRVQPHLKKCFEGIAKLGFDSGLNIYSMFSGEGEQIQLVEEISTVEARGSVEKWLLQVEEQMLISIREVIMVSHGAYPDTDRNVWVTEWPGQVVLCVSQIYWTMDVHSCLRLGGVNHLKKFHESLQIALKDVIALVRGKLSKQTRITLGALVVIDVHSKDVVEDLCEKKVKSESDFQWLAQLRYYWENDVLVRCTNATVRYAYEYLGNTPRLVITPLTDRCYRTLIGAYHLHLNGAPEGPAGTGKTETTKDLAKALAVQCVVFNCSDGLDYIAMGKFFKGLASAGAWACFDEFNRIELEVLSVVAQQILCIIQAVQAGVKKFMFEGTELTLNPACYVCITMNPGYAGRSELPDNLKVLFRTVAMMVPDYALIGEISLYSYGFVDARNLSVKIVTTYRLCSEQLSSQNHYDYGMRAVKTVLCAAGNLKLKFPNEREDILLLRSIIDVNLPKFLSHDVPLFEGIISDLFPGITLPTPNYDTFLTAVREICHTMHLQPVDPFLLKVIQTYEMMIVRHGFMLVGEPFGGKTCTLKVLAGSLTRLEEMGEDENKVRYRIINPKSVTMGQLYGQFDPVSYEWTDGVVATTFRKYAMADTLDRKWVIFDGPVDAVWIENMNTVLDDNKKLCLMSGEIIQLTPPMSMIFEVMDLSQASPATVSRCGMIYMEPSTIGWKPLADSWIEQANPHWMAENEVLFADMFDWLFPPTLLFVRKHCIQLATAGVANLVKTSMLIIQMLLDDAMKENHNDLKHIRIWIQAAFIYAGIWGIGGILDMDSKEAFDAFYKEMWKGTHPDYPVPESLDKIDISIPGEGLLQDYFYNFKTKGSWKYWPEVLRSIKCEEMLNIQQTMVPTIDTARYQYIMELHIKHNVPLLMVGHTGTGKSFYIQNMLMYRLSQEEYIPAFITFTAQTSANQTQELIISKLNKRKRGVYGPPSDKRCVIFVDDMNMPAKEVYGAQPPIELLRQFFDHGHWYDLKDTSKIFLYDILLLAAMGPPGGSRQDVYMRFLRHFSIYAINPFSDDSMQKIFSTVLLIGLRRNGFASDVMTSVMTIVNATLDVYQSAAKDLRPTPAKSHYIFNLRDFSRVIQGCGLVKKESVDNKKVFIKLWVHEVMRIFYDRLIDEDDQKWFYNKIRQAVRDHFHENFETTFHNLPLYDGIVTEESLRDLMFGNYMDPEATDEEKKYEEIPGIEEFLTVCMLTLEEYNATHKTKMDIVLFRFALEHLSRICRILAIPGGSGLLVGVGGSGRQSLTKLATAITGNHFFQPEISKNYGMNEWRDDVKKVLKESGGQGKDTTFLFTESQIKEEIFLQDIDSLLNSGEVPNLFPVDEQQEILEMVRLAAQGGNRNLDISALAVFSFFISRCKQKLHMVLCFSPIGSAFRSRLRLYPSLVNCCTIDWFQVWPEDALERVAHKYMTAVNVPEEVKVSAVIACKYFHVSARGISERFLAAQGRKTYITSAAYLELIRAFTDLTNKKQTEIKEAQQRYLGGLNKLLFAAEQVSAMQKELSDLQPQLVAAAEKTRNVMRMIERETAEVEKASALVREDEKVANVQAAAAQALKDECIADLAEAIPILEDAIEALNTLKPTDITLVKSMKNPPDAIKLVMAAVCVMKDIKPDRINDASTGRKVLDYWGPSKKLLGEMTFLQQLKDYDKDNIAPQIMKTIRTTYLPNKDFKPQIVAKASSAAEGLCKWVIAMDMYDAVAKVVAPKKAKLEIAEREYNTTMALLEEKRRQLQLLEDKLDQLKTQLDEANERKKNLEDEVELCSNKLMRAEKLIGGLGGEKSRWSAAAEALQVDYDSLAGDILVSCGVIAYLAPFTTMYRVECIKDWRNYVLNLKIPSSKEYSFRKVLGSDIKIQSWNIYGLPRDDFSIDNGIIVDTSKRWSLMVDPQGQANKWIKNMEKHCELAVVKFSDSDYMKAMEHCVEFGKPILLENVQEELETPLEPILSKQIFKSGNMWMISLGENVVEYNTKFRFYMTSNLRNPHYLPEVYNKVTLVNFALTIDGLEDQLLGIVVAKERPDLEQKRQNLITQSAANVKALKEVEDNILITLSQTKGNILEDESAIEVLDTSKILSQDIIKKQEAAKETHEKIESFRLSYRPIAAHSSVLYYCVTDLPNVDPMYQYSLGWFINLYIISIETSNKSKVLERRLKFLHDTFTYNLYSNVCRSLFEKDKLLFSFILCTKIMMSKKELNDEEFMFFLTGGVGLENTLSNPAHLWLSDKSWDEICRLNDLHSFRGFLDSFRSNVRVWQDYYDLSEPQAAKLPEPWESRLRHFEKLVVIRVFRPDKVTVSVTRFVDDEMGNKFITPPPFDIAKSYDDSNCLCPLVFILSAGADPMAALAKFAQRMGYGAKFQSISLGQGQGPIAATMIQQAQQEGFWVCLQNCHLAVSWMSALEKICEGFDTTNTDLSFRLWLTSYPSDKFPVSLLQSGVKMTNEPPTGLQQNLLRSYLSEPVKDAEFYDGCPGKDKIFTKLLYAICFFHAVVQERRKFGAIGWNIPYGFNESDFHISIKQLQMFINEYEEIPFDAIRYLTGECNYGGRVTDDWDRRALNTILQDFVNIDVIENLSYTFSPLGAMYGLPRKTEYRDFIKHIEALPAIPPPEVFGLHMNAGITRDLQSSKNLINETLLVHGGGGQGDGGKTEHLLYDIAEDILGKLPKNFDVELANQNYPVNYNESMNTVLVQEMERFNKLLAMIRTTLQNVQKAIKGFVVMSPQLEAIAASLTIAKVPGAWDKVSYPNLKPLGSYIFDFLERLKTLQRWHDYGKPPSFWLSGFFFTQAFLTGAMQNFARKYTIPIDQLVFDYEIMQRERQTIAAVDGVFCFGVFVDGARWDRIRGQLAEQMPKILSDVMPVILFKPTEKSQMKEGARYKCPLYKTSERRGILSTTGHSTNYVLPILLNTDKPPAHWVKRGVALLCQQDD